MPTNKPMNMRMDTETLKQIDAQAEKEHRDRSGMIRHMIATYLENHRTTPPWLIGDATKIPILDKHNLKAELCGDPVHAGYLTPKYACIDCIGGIWEPKDYAKGKPRRKNA